MNIEPDNIFGVGQRFYVESLRGTHFTVIRVFDAMIEAVDQDANKWTIEVGGTMAVYTPGAGAVEEVPLNEVHFK